MIVTGGKQTTVRAHRPLGTDRSDMSAGPLKFEMISPFREWRLTLGDNPQGFTFDIRWYDTKRAIYSPPQRLPWSSPVDIRLLHDWGGYETFGRIAGTVNYKGKTFELDQSKVRGSRDHHWGIRDHNGGISLDNQRPYTFEGEPMAFSHFGQWVEFEDWNVWGSKWLYDLGDKRAGIRLIEVVSQRLRFDSASKHLIGGVVVNRLPTGEIREVHYEQIGQQCAYLRAAGYPGPTGLGTPEHNFHHGMNVGERIDSETYDLTAPAVRKRIAGFEDHLVRATCDGKTTVGILECRNPAIYAMAKAGSRYSILSE
jgi:hypothetical protein